MRMLAVLWFVVSFPRELGGAGSPLMAVMAAVVRTERSQTSLEVLADCQKVDFFVVPALSGRRWELVGWQDMADKNHC